MDNFPSSPYPASFNVEIHHLALLDFDVLPFRAAALGEDSVEEESNTLSGYGVMHHDVLYPRGEMRFVISRPRPRQDKNKRRYVNHKLWRYQLGYSDWESVQPTRTPDARTAGHYAPPSIPRHPASGNQHQ